LRHTFTALALLAATTPAFAAPKTAAPRFSDMPDKFTPPDRRDYTQTVVDIPMRNGVKLHTVILRLKSTQGKAPIILTRTPYNAEGRAAREESTSLRVALGGRYDTILDGGYILVFQDIRGKYGSEGDYVMTRPLVGPFNPTRVDHSTDTYDTIDWLVKNVADNNGRVGITGVSYDGFLTLMGLVDPHPALKAAVPFNPMVDGWVGDDWFHHGAFRAWGFDYIFNQAGSRKNAIKFKSTGRDEYDYFLQWPNSGALGTAVGLDQIKFWRSLKEHPAYDGFWQGQAVDRILADRPLKVPTLLVHSLFDQEDIYGAPAVWKAIEPKDADQSKVFMVMGPWFHGQGMGDGTSIGAVNWGQDTGLWFRRNVLQPFLDAHLKDGAADAKTANVTAFETGTNIWRTYAHWPLSCAQGCPNTSRALYLKPQGKLGFVAAPAGEAASYVSDPAKPVPYIPRPVQAGIVRTSWQNWLLTDQRNVATRPDVLVFQTDPLTSPMKIGGQPVAHLNLTTTGEDGDFVVKLIDVGPEDEPYSPGMAGYQMMVSADIIRARYRNDPAKPERIVPGEPVRITLPLPHANHVFKPGHRIMVQVQSSWFPLYDRNPQTWVPNIFDAPASAYQPATVKVSVSGPDASYIDLPVAPVE